MVQQAARAEIPPLAADPTIAHKLEGLGRDWTVLRECRLHPSRNGNSPTVLIHPGQGIAVLDVSPSATPDAVETVRARLDEARFDGIFAGYLPVVHLRAIPRQVLSLPKLLDDAFAVLPPLSLPGGDAWAGVAARALSAEQAAAPRVEREPSRGSVEEDRQWRQRRARRRRRGAALRKAGAVLLCLAALGGVLAMVLKDMPAPDASTRAAVPPKAVVTPAALPPPTLERAAAREATAIPPVPEPIPPAFTPPAPSGGRTAAPVMETPSPAPPPPEESSTPALPQRAVPSPSPRRPEATPPQARKPPERTAPLPQQQRRQQQEAGADPPPAGGTAPSSEAPPQRCSRVAARIGSGATLSEAEMRFFNEACIRW